MIIPGFFFFTWGNQKNYLLFNISSAANKYYSSGGQHEQKNKQSTSQIKFSVVAINE